MVNTDPSVQLSMQVLNATMGATLSATSPYAQAFNVGPGAAPFNRFMTGLQQPNQFGANPFAQPQLGFGNRMNAPTIQINIGNPGMGGNQAPAAAMLQMVGLLMQSLGRAMQGNPSYGMLGSNNGAGGMNALAQMLMQALAGSIGGMQDDSSAGGADAAATMLPLLMAAMNRGNAAGAGRPAMAMPQLGAPTGGMPTAGGTPTAAGTPTGSAMGGRQMTDDDALRLLSRNFDKISKNHKGGDKDTFTNADLKRVAADRSNPELADAAQHMLDNKNFARGVDVADQSNRHKKSKEDGVYSRKDINTALHGTGNAVGDNEILDGLQKYGKELTGKDGKRSFSTKDLRTIAEKGKLPDGKPAPAELREIARSALARPELLNKLDTAYLSANSRKHGAKSDGRITMQDIMQVRSESRRGGLETTTARTNTPGSGFLPSVSDVFSRNLQANGANPMLMMMLQRAAQMLGVPA